MITVDAFLHLFIEKDKKQPNCDPDISLPIFKKGVELKIMGGESVDIVKKE